MIVSFAKSSSTKSVLYYIVQSWGYVDQQIVIQLRYLISTILTFFHSLLHFIPEQRADGNLGTYYKACFSQKAFWIL